MRKRLLVILLLALLLSAANAETLMTVNIEQGTKLNVRADLGVSQPVLYTLAPGAVVEYVTEESGWMKIRTDEGEGWVRGVYLEPWLTVEDDPK